MSPYVSVPVTVPASQRQRPAPASGDSVPRQWAGAAIRWAAIAWSPGVVQLVSRVPAPLRSIADQLIRSASSVPANLAEGHGRFGRDRQHHWRIAYGSAKEAECHLRLLASAGAVDRSAATRVLESFDQVRAMTWRLLHPL